ncbi:MAG: hypothetical protein QM656_08080 [Paracoccaceae bacterium]
MFAALFGRSNPRLAALEAVRRLHLDQMHGAVGHDLGKVLAAERLAWSRVLSAFRIDPNQGIDANLGQIDDLIATSRALAHRFDFLGLIIPTLMQNSAFLPAEREVLARHLAERGLVQQARRHGVEKPVAAHRPAYGAAPRLA